MSTVVDRRTRTLHRRRIENLVVALQKMGGNLVLYHRKEAEKLGLNPTDSNALGFLAETGAIPAGRLAELMGLSTGAVTAVLDRLEKAGLVHRQSDPDDRRRVLIVPAARGKRGQELSRLFGPLARPFGALVRSYDENELDVILDFVSRTSDLMREEAESRNGAEK